MIQILILMDLQVLLYQIHNFNRDRQELIVFKQQIILMVMIIRLQDKQNPMYLVV